jgi:hypothetical protein
VTPRSFALIFGLLYTGLGVLGLLPAVSPLISVTYARAAAALFAVLTVIGFAYRLHPALGLLALNGYDILLHAVSGLAAAWFGLHRSAASERRHAAADRRRNPRVPVANERRQGFYDRRRSFGSPRPA